MACLPTRCPSRSSGRYFLEKNDVAYIYQGAFAIESRGSDETAPPDPLARGHTRRVADARVRTTPREVAAGRRARVGVASAPLRGCLAPRATDVRLHRRSEHHARRPLHPGAKRPGGGAGGRARAGRHRHDRGPLHPGDPGRHSRSRTIPIIMAPAGAPLQTGFIQSLARPGGNVTGLSGMDAEMGGKRLQLLRQLIPNLRCVAVLGSTPATDPFSGPFVEDLRSAAVKAGLRLEPVLVDGPGAFPGAFTAMVKAKAQAFVVQGLFDPHQAALIELAAKHRL